VSSKVTQTVHEISVVDRRKVNPQDHAEVPILQLVVEHNDDGSTGDFVLAAQEGWRSEKDNVVRDDALDLDQMNADEVRMMSDALGQVADLMDKLDKDEEATS
jgi:hypothetical protein